MVLASAVCWLAFAGAPDRALAQECRVDGTSIIVKVEDSSHTIDAGTRAYACLLKEGRVFAALGRQGVRVYSLTPEPKMVAAWQPTAGEVVGLRVDAGLVVAVTARFEMIAVRQKVDGALEPVSFSHLLGSGDGSPGETGVSTLPREAPGPLTAAMGKVTQVRPEEAVIDLGSEAGIRKGDRFEIRSQKLVKQYDLETRKEVMLPEDRITAVVQVTRVTADSALVGLGRGDRAREGDVALKTRRALTGTNWFPGYQRGLNRVQARLAPFVGIQTLSAGVFSRLLYDRTFSFPVRIETGFRNVGLVFGDTFAAPFQFDLIPSYDTDYFEVGLGTGYSFSAAPNRRGFTFLQKIRLGTVDGLSFTMWNSFIYQSGEDGNWEYLGETGTSGNSCSPVSFEEESLGEFNWNGFDASLAIPLTQRVTLALNGSFSQAGWGYGDVGIRTLVVGNGGNGTLIIPVSIGGGVVIDYGTDLAEYYCDPDSKTVQEKHRWGSESYGGPIVSIGMDYRWH